MTDEIQPLSELTERLQSLAKAKHDDSIMTGREFVDEYGEAAQPLDSEPNRTIATAGGDLQTAYSNLYSAYMKAKNANENARDEFKVTGEATQALNTEALVGDIEIAVEYIQRGVEKLESHDVSIVSDLRAIEQHIAAHAERIRETGMVVVR